MAKITEEISAKVFTEKSWHQRLNQNMGLKPLQSTSSIAS